MAKQDDDLRTAMKSVIVDDAYHHQYSNKVFIPATTDMCAGADSDFGLCAPLPLIDGMIIGENATTIRIVSYVSPIVLS